MATEHISPTVSEEPNAATAGCSTRGPTLVKREAQHAPEQTRMVVGRGWERVKELIAVTQRRVQQTADESPLTFILGVGIAALGLGIASRIWRSNRYARNQFFGKWRT